MVVVKGGCGGSILRDDGQVVKRVLLVSTPQEEPNSHAPLPPPTILSLIEYSTRRGCYSKGTIMLGTRLRIISEVMSGIESYHQSSVLTSRGVVPGSLASSQAMTMAELLAEQTGQVTRVPAGIDIIKFTSCKWDRQTGRADIGAETEPQ